MAKHSGPRWRANQILKLRNDHGLTQEALAALLGCSVATVARWERAHNPPVPSPAYQLALDAVAAALNQARP